MAPSVPLQAGRTFLPTRRLHCAHRWSCAHRIRSSQVHYRSTKEEFALLRGIINQVCQLPEYPCLCLPAGACAAACDCCTCRMRGPSPHAKSPALLVLSCAFL